MRAPDDKPVYRLERDQLAAWLDALIGEGRRVLAPVERRGLRALRAARDAGEVSFASGKTRWSPKETFFPRTEPLFRWAANGDGVVLSDPPATEEAAVLFGVRPCDAAGLVRLDAVLGTDPFYARRRQAVTVVALACAEAEPSCFCTAVGGSPIGEEGADVLLAAVGDRWALRVITPKGDALVAAHRGRWVVAAPSDWESARSQAAEAAERVEREELPAAWAETLEGRFEDAKWNDLAERCVGCSVCAYVCPTCSCFDVADEGSDSCGTRCRTWDSCSLRLFTLHASGHNPRPSQAARARQRVLHKFAYYPLRHDGALMCVGCGRCIEHCPVGMNIHEEVLAIMAGGDPKGATDVGD
ncbi:MAG: 4Fe-4S dicluster domain-containing protein [bacterium]